MSWLKRNILLLALFATMLWVTAPFLGPVALKKTPLCVMWGTIYTTFGSVFLTALPAYLMAAALAGILPLSPNLERLFTRVFHVLSGMPSIVFGIIGFSLFCQSCRLGWSILSATLTLSLMLFPVLVTGFLQILESSHRELDPLCRSLGVSPLEFLFRLIPKFKLGSLLSVLAMGWGRACSDTAAVMLTCGAVLEMPASPLDPVRTLGYHIYLLGMETPGGMPEARALCLLAILGLLVAQFVPNLIINLKEAR